MAQLTRIVVVTAFIAILVVSTGGFTLEGEVAGSDNPNNTSESNPFNHETENMTGDDRRGIVDRYVVTSINGSDNQITVTAEIRDNVNTNGMTVQPQVPSEATDISIRADGNQVLSTQDRNTRYTLETDADEISYSFSLMNPHQQNQFVSEDVVFLRQYGFQFVDKQYTSGTDNITIGESVNYESIHTSDDGLAIYRSETTVTNVNENGHEIDIISSVHHDDSDEAEATETVAGMFTDEQEPEYITIYVLPTDGVRSGGFAIGHTDDEQTIWVSQHSEYELEHTTMHETVHAHQDFSTDTELEWFTEGSAQYVATLGMSIQTQNYNAGAVEFNEDWYYGQENTSDVQLSQPSSWERNAQYNRGEHVSYLIDISIRHHTDGEVTIIDLIQWMNREGNVDYDEFRERVVRHTDEEFGNQLDYYIDTTEVINISEETGDITGNETVRLPN